MKKKLSEINFEDQEIEGWLWIRSWMFVSIFVIFEKNEQWKLKLIDYS